MRDGVYEEYDTKEYLYGFREMGDDEEAPFNER